MSTHLDPKYKNDNLDLSGELNSLQIVPQISEQAQIIIGGGYSAHEKTGSRYVQYLLKSIKMK